ERAGPCKATTSPAPRALRAVKCRHFPPESPRHEKIHGMRIPTFLFPMTLLLAACSSTTAIDGAISSKLRLATYNTSLYSDEPGGLIRTLEGDSSHARKIAAVLQQVRPDLVLLNEFDYDTGHRAAALFQQRYLAVAQPGGGEPLHYPYRYL